MSHDPFSPLRQMMVRVIAAHTIATENLTGIGALNPRLLGAIEDVPRHEFVPVEIRAYAHADGPLPIGCDKTISQPFITALMTALLELEPEDRVLEIGTGLGYHTAVLAMLARKVYTIEYVDELAKQAWLRLENAGIGNVEWRIGNGYFGWPEQAPFDKIVAASAPELIPPALISQLKPGGRMVLPAGLDDAQQLMVVEKDPGGKIHTRDILAVRFAPMEGVEDLGV